MIPKCNKNQQVGSYHMGILPNIHLRGVHSDVTIFSPSLLATEAGGRVPPSAC